MSDKSSEIIQEPEKRLSGMLGFTVVWIGQMFSLLGTNMTGFAMTIWAWQVTGQATTLALVGFFSFAPVVLMSPIAGAIVDRHNRKHIMMLADLAAGLPTVAVLLLFLTNNLQIWHLYITGLVAGSFQAFHFPAYSAAVTMMVSKKHYGRASGMLSTAQFVANILAPVLAALVMSLLGITAVLSIDIVTFTVAICMLFFVHIRQPPMTEAGHKGMGSLWKESLYGFRYIYERPSLLGLQLVFFCINLVATFGNTVLSPMILARTESNLILGTVFSAGGVGGLIGSIVLTIWGGPKRKVHGLLLGMAFLSIFSGLMMGTGRDVTVWATAAFLSMLFMPIVNGSSQAIWQSKVAPDVQGRVFATRLLIAQISVPAAMLLAGSLADWLFEPAMTSTGYLSPAFGWLVGTGHGAGMALMLFLAGIFGIFICVGGYAFRTVRNAETILPDYEAKAPPVAEK